MENSNSEIHNLIISTVAELRKDYQRESTEIKLEIAALRPCFQTKKACDERHIMIEARMVDKMLFVGASGMLFVVIAVVGVILMLR